MTEIPMNEPGSEEPLILESLSGLDEEPEYLRHYPDIRGRQVVNPSDDEVGVVDDLYVDPRRRRVSMVAVTFCNSAGYEGKRALVPVEELQIVGDKVRVVTRNHAVRRPQEATPGQQSFEPYYEYWSRYSVGPGSANEPETARSGRLELEGEEEEEIGLPVSG